MAAYFINKTTHEIYDYYQLQALPEFNDPNDTPGWPSDPFVIGVTDLIAGFNIARLIDTPRPAGQLWEIVAKGSPVWKLEDDVYSWNWVTRNMTTQELADFNAIRKADNDFARRMRYIEEADPLFFMAQRNETTSQEWIDKCNAIKADLPNPAPVVIP